MEGEEKKMVSNEKSSDLGIIGHMISPGFYMSQDSSQIIKSFQCPICMEVLKDPMSCSSGHSICSACWTKAKDIDNPICPICRIKGNLTQNMALGLIIADIKVCCTMCNESCDYGDIEHHEKNRCSQRTVNCPNMDKGCKWVGIYHNSTQHLITCPYRVVECKYCDEQIIYNKQNIHLETVYPNGEVVCEYCKIICIRKDIKNHHTTCQSFPVMCHAPGCTDIFPRENTQQHLNTCVFHNIDPKVKEFINSLLNTCTFHNLNYVRKKEVDMKCTGETKENDFALKPGFDCDAYSNGKWIFGLITQVHFINGVVSEIIVRLYDYTSS